jgi:hypothetical protein
MGLSVNGTQFILYAKTQGVDYTRTAMIGRQGLHLTASELRANLMRLGFSWDEGAIEPPVLPHVILLPDASRTILPGALTLGGFAGILSILSQAQSDAEGGRSSVFR